MAMFKIKAGFKGQDVGVEFQEDIPGGDSVERAYRTYVMAGIAKVVAEAAVIAQTGDDPVQQLLTNTQA